MMPRTRALFALASLSLVSVVALLDAQVGASRPDWAYAIPPPGAPGAPPPNDVDSIRIPGAARSFTTWQLRDPFAPGDWFPNQHPRMPDVVAFGRRVAGTTNNGRAFMPAADIAARGGVVACALCHYPNGQGRPENAGPAGLHAAYIVQQLNDFRNGMRRSADTRKANTVVMINIAKAMTQQEIKDSAAYFSSIPYKPWIKVVETNIVPRMRSEGGIFFPSEEAGTEPIGVRIIETPVNGALTELRDPRSGFIAYAPEGSIRKGEDLAEGRTSTTSACRACHGAGLKGMGDLVPPLAGRSPSYIARQLYDMQHSTRRGVNVGVMKRVVAKLTQDDIVNISAYIAALTP